MKISISGGNSKMGEIPSVSLPPITTCRANAPCAKKCYAARYARMRKSVREAYARNYEIWKTNPALYWLQVEAAAAITKYFRFHVSGDIPDAQYFADMIGLAKRQPETSFLCFTKKYEIVNEYAGELPNNLHIVFSAWADALRPNNPKNLPIAEVVFKGKDPNPDWYICPGHCQTCACRGIGCWALKCGETIAFPEH